MTEVEKRKIGVVADLLRRGGVMLKEACPRCGGVMVRYKEQTLCVECDTIDDLRAVQVISLIDTVQRLKSLILAKIDEVMKQLSGERDVERQVQMATLLLRYMEILEKTTPKPEKTEESGKRQTV